MFEPVFDYNNQKEIDKILKKKKELEPDWWKWYNFYLASKEWKRKRKIRLKIDDNKCRGCGHDGTERKLQLHHIPGSYSKIPFESIKEDLITFCAGCHGVLTREIRERKDRIRDEELSSIDESHQRKRSTQTFHKTRDIITVESINSGYIEYERELVCPVCDYWYQWVGEPRWIGGEERDKEWNKGRGELVILPIAGECGSEWEIHFGIHKGITYTIVKVIKFCGEEEEIKENS